MCFMARGSGNTVWLLMATDRLEHLAGLAGHFFNLNLRCVTQLKHASRFLALENTVQEKVGGEEQPKSWPSAGVMEFKNVNMRYRPTTDLVLNELSFTVKAGEHVGIVGRTGAGKSSLAQTISRIMELESGSICVDGQDISKIDIQELRKAVTVIPQDPALYKGTLRFNLDPFNVVPDREILDLLQRAGLNDLLERSEKAPETEQGINMKISEGGENLSIGEKQLICICRAILRKNKIVILDEATANIDVVTEQKIQALVQNEFKGATVLTIAHRLNTII